MTYIYRVVIAARQVSVMKYECDGLVGLCCDGPDDTFFAFVNVWVARTCKITAVSSVVTWSDCICLKHVQHTSYLLFFSVFMVELDYVNI